MVVAGVLSEPGVPTEAGSAFDEPAPDIPVYAGTSRLLRVACRTKIPGLAGKGAKVLMLALRIGALNPCDSFCIVPAIENIQDSFLDTDDSERAVGFGVPLLVAFLKVGKMRLEDALDNIWAAWYVPLLL